MCDPPVNSVPLKQLRIFFFRAESSETVALNYLWLIFDPFQSLRRNTKGSHAEGGEDDAILTHYRGFVEGRATPPVGPAGF